MANVRSALREVGAVAPVLAGAEEEHLNARLPAVLVGGEHVGFLDALGIDGLVGGDVSQRPEPVAVFGGLLVVEPVGRFLHQALIHLAHVLALAAQEAHGLPDQRVVLVEADLAGARRRAALDLMQQARPRAALEHGVRARPQQERPLQHVDGAVDRAGRGERPEVFALAVARAAMLEDLRRPVLARQQDERERLVVPQQHVVARTKALDQVGFQQQRFRLRAHAHEFHGRGVGDHAHDAVGMGARARVAGHTRLQAAGFADVDDGALGVDHPVHARRIGERLQVLGDHRRSGRHGAGRPAHRRCGAGRHLAGVLEGHGIDLRRHRVPVQRRRYGGEVNQGRELPKHSCLCRRRYFYYSISNFLLRRLFTSSALLT